MTGHHRIFLGHASEDKPQVRELYHQLKSKGFSPWLDAVDLVPGQNWRVEIPKAIQEAGVFLACLSKRSVEKQSYVQREFRYALSAYANRPPGSIYLIPVRLDDCEVPDLRLAELELNLRDLHWMDLFDEDGFERLAQAIDHALDTKSDGPSENPEPVSLTATERSRASEATKLQMRWNRQVRSRGTRDPAIKAVWIGAGAVVISGVLASPWLIGAFKTAPQYQQAQTKRVEPAAGAPTPFASWLDAYQPFEAFRSCNQDLCPEMEMIPAGEFLMGSPESKAARHRNEGPQHEVTISQAFAIGKHEVTFEEYDRFAETTGGEKSNDRGWGRGKRPVIDVNWAAAKDY